jgi:hypothetical protein
MGLNISAIADLRTSRTEREKLGGKTVAEDMGLCVAADSSVLQYHLGDRRNGEGRIARPVWAQD